MRPAARAGSFFVAMLAAAGASAWAADGNGSAATSLIYSLTGDPSAGQSLLAARWGSPTLLLRLDTAAGLGAHEVRVLSASSTSPPSLTQWAAAVEPLADVTVAPVRATYRYTLLAEPTWEMKFGLSTNVGEYPGGLRPSAGTERTSFGSLPLLHVAGVGQWSPRLRFAFAVDGLATGRGRAVDLGVEVDYSWTPSMSLFGGYQLTDAAGDAASYFGGSASNRANVGLRYRF